MGANYGQSTSHVTSISENEMNIRISLCNVRRVNGMLNISLEIVPKRRINWKKKKKKIQNTWEIGKQLLFLKFLMLCGKEKLIALYHQ